MKIIEHFPNLIQTLRYDCGATALLSVLTYFDIYSNIKQLKAETQTKVAGTTPERITEISNKHGLKATFCENMTLEDLEKNIDKDLPVFVSIQIKRKPYKDITDIWSKGHFTIVIGYDENNIYMSDPKFPFTTFLTRKDFVDRWHDSDNYPNMIKTRRQHYGITFDPPNDWQPNNEPRDFMETLEKMAAKYKLKFKK